MAGPLAGAGCGPQCSVGSPVWFGAPRSGMQGPQKTTSPGESRQPWPHAGVKGPHAGVKWWQPGPGGALLETLPPTCAGPTGERTSLEPR